MGHSPTRWRPATFRAVLHLLVEHATKDAPPRRLAAYRAALVEAVAAVDAILARAVSS